MWHRLFFLALFPFVQPSPDLDLRVPQDLPFAISAAKKEPVVLGKLSGDRYVLEVRNASDAPILALVFKKVCAPPSEEPVSYPGARVATTELYFYHGQGSQVAPIGVGETRPVNITVFRGFGPGSNCALIPFSALFEDGKSWGVREPYATKYVSVLHTWIEGHEEKSLDSENRELMHTLKHVANAIVTESNIFEMRQVRP